MSIVVLKELTISPPLEDKIVDEQDRVLSIMNFIFFLLIILCTCLPMKER